MPVYILREGVSNVFKIGRTSGSIDGVLKRHRTSNSQPFTVFEVVEADNVSACEAFFHRRLRSKRVVRGGGWEFFEVDPLEMLVIVRDLRSMFDQLEEARREVSRFQNEASSDSILEPNDDDEELMREILRNREEQEYLQLECELLESKLKERIGCNAGIRGLATWKTQTSRIYSEEVFKRNNPDKYQKLLEKFPCLDTKAWKESRPDEYKEVQTTYFVPRTCRAFKLQKAG